METSSTATATGTQTKADPRALALQKQWGAMKAARQPFDTLWQDVSSYVIPRKSAISTTYSPSLVREERLFDGTAVLACQKLAGAFVSWLTPAGVPWFSIEPPRGVPGDRAAQWCATVTELMREYLAGSNFYTVNHESALDICAMGTRVMHCESGPGGVPLWFDSFDAGTYAIDEDAYGFVVRCGRAQQMSAEAMAGKFGREKLPPRVVEALAKPETMGTKFAVVQMIQPRENRDASRPGALNMPVESVVFMPDECVILHESGYEEMPFAANRYLLWSLGDGVRAVYGYAPSWVALPEARQLNFLEMLKDALAEKMAFPPLLVHESQEGKIDSRARGVTFFKSDDTKPAEWQTSGRIDAAIERSENRKKAIRDAFHLDVLAMFDGLDAGKMTATEILSRKEEKISNIDPCFTRAMTEFVQPTLMRALAVCMRGGHLPEPPEEMLMVDGGSVVMPLPKVVFSNRFVLAQRATHSAGFMRTVDFAMAIAAQSGRPDVLDNFNFDKALRDIARTEGTNPDWLADEGERDKGRAARAQAQAQQAQMAQAAMAADAAGKLGKVQPGTVADNAVRSLAGGGV